MLGLNFQHFKRKSALGFVSLLVGGLLSSAVQGGPSDPRWNDNYVRALPDSLVSMGMNDLLGYCEVNHLYPSEAEERREPWGQYVPANQYEIYHTCSDFALYAVNDGLRRRSFARLDQDRYRYCMSEKMGEGRNGESAETYCAGWAGPARQ